METIKSSLVIALLIKLVTLAEGTLTADGRVGLRLYKDEPTSFIQELMESGLKIFEDPYYNKSVPILILIHGMDTNVDCGFVKGTVKALHLKGLKKQYNIIALNLPELLAVQKLHDKFLYTTAKNCEVAGNAIGDFFNEVIRLKYTSSDKINIIGYSMGAQVAGYLARKIRDAHGLIHFLLGLDPAGIGFRPSTLATWVTKLVHVSSDDAKFTHFIHVNSLVLGTRLRNATANFVFNGGNIQPGCMKDKYLACSHVRVPHYFIESILYPKNFPAKRCESWKRFLDCNCTSEDIRYVTFPPDLNASGVYYLRTNGHSGYGQGQDGISCIKEDQNKVIIVKKKKDLLDE